MTPTQKDSTALQELIANREQELKRVNNENGYSDTYRAGMVFKLEETIRIAKSLLPKDRQRIIDDFDNGQANWEKGVRDYENGLDYFNKTFKQ